MDPKRSLFLTVIATFILFEQGQCLKCYVCTSMMDPKCGTTWGFSKDEAMNYTETCVGDTVACRKFDTTDTHKGGTLVTRACWNTSSNADMDDLLTCQELALGEACYCQGDNDRAPCNRGPRVMNYATYIVILFTAAFNFILYVCN